ncbi:hypothetical protein [Microbacterium sp. TNHR37B]|uniref:hypothetical protein n=1 Tax=Microbacterium sp. TNHR37B TaxID=1775956 RepID=UPI0007B28089|nr:hypothetical protein [Microbacterium sp. TNHR37B]KZE90694.1 hypothetical protein AVP41_00213 [Microbacterium sp. TNHR37B]
MSDEHTSPRPKEETGGRFDEPVAADLDQDVADDATSTTEPGSEPVYGIGPFSLREVVLLGVWALAFIVSFFSVWVDTGLSSVALPFGSVWSSGIDWILTIGVPTVAVFLIVLRRFSPEGIRRVGSLAVDQFASVAFSVSAVVWLGILWTNITRGIQTGIWLSSWVVWVEFFLMTAGVFLTVLAPFIRPFDEDFRDRPEVPAHRNARPVRAVIPRPAQPRTVAPIADGASDEPHASYDAAFAPQTDTGVVETAPPASQAFWALAPEEREVVDENGLPLFTVGPTAWALVIEDRGSSFVVRHEDGRVGVLTDVSGVTRG